MKDELNRDGPVQHLMLRYAKALMSQMAQTAVCNCHHVLEQHLFRWLLLSLDRLRSNEHLMTHELIASKLGVRREGVTESAFKLQEAGLIRYARGRIEVLDRKRAWKCAHANAMRRESGCTGGCSPKELVIERNRLQQQIVSL